MKYEYNPDYLVPPGEILKDCLETYKLSVSELSIRSGLSVEIINKIINNSTSITPEIATRLESVFLYPKELWLNLEILYQEDIKKKWNETLSSLS